jgi:hypothetical protein
VFGLQKRTDFWFQGLELPKINGHLSVEPEVGGSTEGSGEFHCDSRSYASSFIDNAIDDFVIATEMESEFLLGNTEGLEELLAEDFSGGCRFPFHNTMKPW